MFDLLLLSRCFDFAVNQGIFLFLLSTDPLLLVSIIFSITRRLFYMECCIL